MDLRPESGNVLEHLLRLEAEASALVDGARAEADRRIAEGEKRNRARYEEIYSKEAAAMAAALESEIESVRKRYEAQLAAYRESLGAITSDRDRFRAMVDSFLKEG
jgi:F0F1-type ATP synthase membrane subunit b/b'